MIGNNSVLVIIPARGGSKGIPKKNIKPLNGKPLIQYSIDVAKKSKYVDEIVVSTDSEEIENVSLNFGVNVTRRPSELSGDSALVEDAVRYTINNQRKKYDLVLLLEPTSPLRTVELVDECIEKLNLEDVECLATFCETDIPPARIWKLLDEQIDLYIEGSNPWLPRQKLDKGYQLNGLVYGLKTSVFMKTKSGRMMTKNITSIITPREISIDIDDMLDFKFIELLLKEKND